MSERVELRARPNHIFVYSGPTLLATDVSGRISRRDGEGFYLDNTRLLSRDELSVAGKTLTPIVASAAGANGHLAYWQLPEADGIPDGSIYAEVSRVLDEGMRTRVKIDNFGREELSFDLAWRFEADFADIDEAEQGKRQQSGPVDVEWDDARRELSFRYRQPGLDRALAVRVERAPGPVWFKDGELLFPVDVSGRSSAEIEVAVTPIFDGQRRKLPEGTLGRARTHLDDLRRELEEGAPKLETTNTTVARAWQTAISDLASLPLGLESGPAAPIAGLPLYQHFFGRDTLTIAWQAALAMPRMLKDALAANAAWQGKVIDDWRDEEPGKLIHQARSGPLSLLGKNPFVAYYGDYAAPPDFLIMLGQYLGWSGDLATARSLLPAARKVIDWIERYGDLDGDGFLEYEMRSPKGVKNQGWKDSEDAIVDERGEIVQNPIAASEIQAYWYSGLRQVAIAFFAAGDRAYAFELLKKASALKRRFNEAFWMEDQAFYALALDPSKRQVRSIASNTGHLLATGIVPGSRAHRVTARLFEPDLFSGWGIRTLSSRHPSFNPFAYHLGSVWPVENGTFCIGLGLYGVVEELHRLARAIFDASELFAENRLPEAIGGIARDPEHPHPGIYPKANVPQGWSASAIVVILQALLGMRPVAPLNLLVVDPHLPDWLPELRLRGVRVGNASIDLEVWREPSGKTKYRTRNKKGKLRVIRQPPPESPQTSLQKRAAYALRSLPFA